MVKAAVLREIAEGVVPQRQVVQGRVPFNLMESETLVWVMEDVDHVGNGDGRRDARDREPHSDHCPNAADGPGVSDRVRRAHEPACGWSK